MDSSEAPAIWGTLPSKPSPLISLADIQDVIAVVESGACKDKGRFRGEKRRAFMERQSRWREEFGKCVVEPPLHAGVASAAETPAAHGVGEASDSSNQASGQRRLLMMQGGEAPRLIVCKESWWDVVIGAVANAAFERNADKVWEHVTATYYCGKGYSAISKEWLRAAIDIALKQPVVVFPMPKLSETPLPTDVTGSVTILVPADRVTDALACLAWMHGFECHRKRVRLDIKQLGTVWVYVCQRHRPQHRSTRSTAATATGAAAAVSDEEEDASGYTSSESESGGSYNDEDSDGEHAAGSDNSAVSDDSDENSVAAEGVGVAIRRVLQLASHAEAGWCPWRRVQVQHHCDTAPGPAAARFHYRHWVPYGT
ncbi:MAG: hypothetical protein Q7U97_17925 [Rhodocyclaceae bacterium]|nr:hypothetical protein [Rhodocyclaceae bacterium]